VNWLLLTIGVIIGLSLIKFARWLFKKQPTYISRAALEEIMRGVNNGNDR
jgi:hypothetical protein